MSRPSSGRHACRHPLLPQALRRALWSHPATLLAAVLALPAAAPAGAVPTFGVATYAVASDTGGTFAGAGYNAWFVGDPSQLLIDFNQGAVAGSNCTGACSAAHGASPSAPGGTAASSQGVLHMAQPGTQATTADARANASLALGTVGVYASGERRPSGNAFLEGSFGTATARLADTLAFHVAGADANTRTRIGVSFVIDGGITDCSGGSMNFNLGFGAAQAFGSVGENCSSDYVGGSVSAGWLNAAYTTLTAELIRFDAEYELVGADVELGLLTQLKANAGSFGAVDYLHTGAFSLRLPDGVSYSSASGVFLAGDGGTTSPVPEPGALPLVGLGLAALLLSRRLVRG